MDPGLIYVLDDEQELTELYALFLQGTGYTAKAFNQRTEALAALAAATPRPHLLILDVFTNAMSIRRFVRSCLAVHPSLHLLIAGGAELNDARFPGAQRARFIQKPFTAHEFLREVKAVLAA